MPNKNEKKFLEKFKLLNSQDYNDEINWSSSPSSDVENINNNVFNRSFKVNSKKRKRKKTAPKNISNLDIKVIDSSFANTTIFDCEKSSKICNEDLKVPSSPILQTFRNKKSRYEFITSENAISPNTSPILGIKNNKSPILEKTSPILKVRKQIFNTDYGLPSKSTLIKELSCSSIIETNKGKKIEEDNLEKNDFDMEFLSQCSKKIKLDDDLICKAEECIENIEEYYSSEDSKSKILDCMKSYFDTHFSSSNTSVVISEDLTPKSSSTSDEIQILTCKTQIPSSPKQESSIFTSKEEKTETKKVKYKKDGLAFRLSNLLKKQNANLNLWRHEKFLAGNANFLIPKTNCLIFHIKTVKINYGCYLLHAVDEHEIDFLIIINNEYVLENISPGSIFKLYKPYTIKNINNINLITNVCKFENQLMSVFNK